MKRIYFTAILLLSFIALKAQDKKAVADSVFFGKAYIANPDTDQPKEWCVNTTFELTVLHDGDKLSCTLCIANKKIKGYLSPRINKVKPGKLFGFHAVENSGPALFSILFITFADYKKNTNVAEIIDGKHYLSKWYDVKGCFIDNPILWTEK